MVKYSGLKYLSDYYSLYANKCIGTICSAITPIVAMRKRKSQYIYFLEWHKIITLNFVNRVK